MSLHLLDGCRVLGCALRFETRVSLVSPSGPGTHGNPPASVSLVLRLQADAIPFSLRLLSGWEILHLAAGV